MMGKSGVVLKVKHSADSYNEDKKEGRVNAKKHIELEQNAAKAIMNLKHRRECSGGVTKFSWCSDQLCRMWYDMSQYFGFLGEDIIDTDIDNAIISVADGGSGIYERLIVLGHRILDASGKEYAVKKYTESGIEGLPRDANRILEGNKKLLLFLKMRWFSSSICSVSCLAKFARKYSHYCKAELNSQNAAFDDNKLAKYIKFCISFCIYGQGMIDWNSPLSVDDKLCKRFPWIEILIRSIDMSIINPPIRENDRFLTNEEIMNAKTLEILWRYFGYDKNKKSIPPRISFALNTKGDAQLPEEKTGQVIFNHYVSHYFKSVAGEHGFTGVDLLYWVEKEKNTLLESNSVELFSLIYLELGVIYSNGASNIDEKLSRYRGLFFSFIANMFVLSDEDSSAQLWLQELVTCVRQIQLYILEYQEFVKSQASKKTNAIPENEVCTVSENCLDHTHVPKIFLDLEHDEVKSLITILENCNAPDIVEMAQAFIDSSRYCINSIVDIVNIPKKMVGQVFKKIIKRSKAKCKLGTCRDEIFISDSDSELDSKTNSDSCDNADPSEIFESVREVKEERLDLKKRRNGSRNRKEARNNSEINNVYCAEALGPILKPVALKSEEKKVVEIQPVSITLINEEGRSVHYTLRPNDACIPEGTVKPVSEIVTNNKGVEFDEKDRTCQRRSRSPHIFSRNAGRSRSPSRGAFRRREHGILICGDHSQNYPDLNGNVRVFNDPRDYTNYIRNTLPENYGYSGSGIAESAYGYNIDNSTSYY
ncbi:hypothetical protein FG386_001956 [Cryptosporidium ryanae]|uniref:uncharacterized protein n=1 Tax=Cryptosporidium ryanae TaxID=515981 RepID=UPI003519F44C|nr:hypothetical protein FG386_001956 [Cryptosporidium ryanae]